MELEKFTKEICKTGFVLENRIAVDLKREGWTVISNKYYEDDFEGSVREIDPSSHIRSAKSSTLTYIQRF